MLYWVVDHVFTLQPRPRPTRPENFRTTSACNPSVHNSFHTLDFASSATHAESMVCALFGKQGGVYPQKAKPRRNPAASTPCCRPRRFPNLRRATQFHDPAILRSRLNLN